MKKVQPSVIVVNILGAIGYMLALTGWVLLASVLLTLLLAGSSVVVLEPAERVADAPSMVETSKLVAYSITGVVALVTIVLVAALPYFIGKWSSISLRWLLKLLRISSTKRHLFLAKSVVTTLPLVGFFVVTFFIIPSMTFSALYITTVATAILALIFFLLQLIIARAMKLPGRLVW